MLEPSYGIRRPLLVIATALVLICGAMLINTDHQPGVYMLSNSSQAARMYISSVDLTPKARSHVVVEHAIVIPYRNRSYHLDRFTTYLGPYLYWNFPNDSFSLWIIEQADDHLFNRGWLGNVGIAEVLLENSRTQCVIFHDVDLLPDVNGVPYNNCTLPTQLGSELEHFGWQPPYWESFGGVVSMHMDHWRKTNGFSNNYVGWGGEDDDLYHRVRINGLLDDTIGTVRRPPKGKGRFRAINQSSIYHPKGVKGEKEYSYSLEILEEMRKDSGRWMTDGLSNLQYTIVDCAKGSSLGFSIVHYIKCASLQGRKGE